MQGTFIGFNTAGITYEDHFMALLLKVKHRNGMFQTYYLQAPVLADLLMVWQTGCLFSCRDYSRMARMRLRKWSFLPTMKR